jgi:hypothetical protein
MPLPFDATLKDLVQQHPRDYLATFDVVPEGPVEVLNPDLSTVTTAADIVFGLGDPLTEIVHLEFQSSAAENLPRNVLAYNALLHRHYRVAVHSVVILLRPEARHSNLDGTVAYESRPGRSKMWFRYEVVEVWKRPVEELLSGSLGILPLATLGHLPESVPLEQGLAVTIQRLTERLLAEAPPEHAKRLLTAAFVLTGMRVDRARARELFKGVAAMRESDTYMAILEEGAKEGELRAMRRVLLRQGRIRFGDPEASVRGALETITDIERLERLTERLLVAKDWHELLQTS